jgi:hypothetical protein
MVSAADDDVLLLGVFSSEGTVCPAVVAAVSISAEVKNAITNVAVAIEVVNAAVVLICIIPLSDNIA